MAALLYPTRFDQEYPELTAGVGWVYRPVTDDEALVAKWFSEIPQHVARCQEWDARITELEAAGASPETTQRAKAMLARFVDGLIAINNNACDMIATVTNTLGISLGAVCRPYSGLSGDLGSVLAWTAYITFAIALVCVLMPFIVGAGIVAIVAGVIGGTMLFVLSGMELAINGMADSVRKDGSVAPGPLSLFTRNLPSFAGFSTVLLIGGGLWAAVAIFGKKGSRHG